MTKQTEALKLALEALNSFPAKHMTPFISSARTAIREALAEQPAIKQDLTPEQPAHPQQEPVATKLETQQFNCFHVSAEDFQKLKELPVGTKLYTSTPAQHKPLTDEEIMAIGKQLGLKCRLGGNPNIDFDYARAIEAAHGIKGDA